VTRIIGLTGGIGSGKSTVARLFEARGAVVIDADAIVHELQAPGSPALQEIEAVFGSEVIDGDGALDREKLGAIVFRDADARRKLNAIIHPRVGVEMTRRVAAARAADAPLVLLEIQLLLESRGRAADPLGIEAVVVVYAPEETMIERQIARNGYGRDEAVRRLQAQMPIEEKRALADFVIDNSGDLAETERQVDAVMKQLLGSPSGTGDGTC